MGQVRLFPSSLKGKHKFMVVLQKTLFKWRHYESEIILAFSYRDLEATVLKVKQKVAWQADAKPHYP